NKGAVSKTDPISTHHTPTSAEDNNVSKKANYPETPQMNKAEDDVEDQVEERTSGDDGWSDEDSMDSYQDDYQPPVFEPPFSFSNVHLKTYHNLQYWGLSAHGCIKLTCT